MVCPKCGRRMDWYLEGLIRPGFNSRYCIGCGARLELINSATCYTASGLLFVFALLMLIIGNVPYLWLWLIFLAIVFWLINPLFIRGLGKWQVYSYTQAELAKLKLLNAVNTISTLTAAVWVGHMIFILFLPYHQIIEQLANLDDKAFESIEQYKQTVNPAGIAGILVGAVSISLSGTTSWLRGNLRRQSIARRLDEKQNEQQREEQ